MVDSKDIGFDWLTGYWSMTGQSPIPAGQLTFNEACQLRIILFNQYHSIDSFFQRQIKIEPNHL